MRTRAPSAAAALLVWAAAGCSTDDEAPTAAWCAAMEPFVGLDESSTRTVEVVEITEDNRDEVERESAELRSRIAVLVSSAPSSIRDDVDVMLNGGTESTVEQIGAAREEVSDFHRRRC